MIKTLLLLSTIINIQSLYGQQMTATVTGSEKDLIPEGIAVDGRTGLIYVSSIARQKIVVIDQTGKQKDFIANGEEGFMEGLGMKVDTVRNLLWAISVKSSASFYQNRIHGFDLHTAKTKYVYSIEDTLPVMFNDLDLDNQGRIFITDTYSSRIYLIDVKTGNPEIFFSDPQLRYPNGIAIGRNEQLYLASYGSGLVRIDLKTGKTFGLNGYRDTVVAHGMDGLIYYKNSLIGVYNYSYKKQGFDEALLVRYYLDASGTTITNEEIIDRGNPLFHQPTTISLNGNECWVLANSHLEIYNANGKSLKGKEGQLLPVTVIKYRIK